MFKLAKVDTTIGPKAYKNIYAVLDDDNKNVLICLPPSDHDGWVFSPCREGKIFSFVRENLKDEFLHNHKFWWIDKSLIKIISDDPKKIENITEKQGNSNMNTTSITSNGQNKQSLGQTIMSDFDEAKYLIAADQAISLVRNLILSVVEGQLQAKHGNTKGAKKKVEFGLSVIKDFLETEFGYFIISQGIGYLMKYASEFGAEYVELMKHPAIQKMAKNIRIQGMVRGGNAMVEQFKDVVIMPVLTQFNALRVLDEENSEKTRIHHSDDEEAEKEVLADEEVTHAKKAKA